MRGNLLSFQHKCGARNDQTLTRVSAEPNSEKSAWLETSPQEVVEVLKDSSKERFQWIFMQSCSSLILDLQLSSAVVCSPSAGVLQCVLYPADLHQHIFWWWRILSSSVGCNRFYCFFSCLCSFAALKSSPGASGRKKQLSRSGQSECVYSITHYTDITLTDPSTVQFDP